jgi:hypothetical protein
VQPLSRRSAIGGGDLERTLSEISDLLARTVAPRVQSELQHYLKGLFGGIVKGYLPQTWWFSTESGHATLHVGKDGGTRVTEGRSGQPDVSISWTNKAFGIALSTGDRSKLPANTLAPIVEVHSSRGKAAYNQLKKRLGL